MLVTKLNNNFLSSQSTIPDCKIQQPSKCSFNFNIYKTHPSIVKLYENTTSKSHENYIGNDYYALKIKSTSKIFPKV